ncbi:hypothetical protein WICPIJ_001240 [Wickerhamomyces pijperi]|uniref:JmjC domain-containing protein n=1 Tax=Wickerhamomyces pijperi TaxID=599730 RepID=A0A9P8QE15_WICPI|nr:hypothetical protein WICPIJ_001240 [Wickerhamomyces pijperi]
MTVEPPRKKRNISKGISRNIHTDRHPLNVKPSGNSLIFTDNTLKQQKASLLGELRNFDDNLILDLLSFIEDPQDLLQLSHASRIFYAFTYDEDIWRKLYMKKSLKDTSNPTGFPLGINKWRGSWRRTMLNLPESKEAKIQLPENLLCSDALFRPFQCSKIDYNALMKDLIDEEEESYQKRTTLNQKFGIKRIAETDLSVDEFNTKHLNTPFILTNDNYQERWPLWTFPQLLRRFPNIKFRQESVEWPLHFYADYYVQNSDESPLYLFDCQSVAMKELVKEYRVPEIFKNDYFQLFNQPELGVNCRPDYRWIIIGPERSGSTFHKDPNFTSAWNANLSGVKLWVMLPPGVKPPGIGTDDTESEVTSPVGVAEWVLSGFYNDTLKLTEYGECKIGLTFPGEVMYVPSGWWHSVINLDDSVALTQNFIPGDNLARVLFFLKVKSEQISGFHMNKFKTSLKNFINHAKSGIDAENLALFEKFLQVVEDLDNDEDIGEVDYCSVVGRLPIYEFFLELIKNDGKREQLQKALVELANIEREEAKKEGKNVVASKKWESLVDGGESTGFSFGFDEDDDEDED